MKIVNLKIKKKTTPLYIAYRRHEIREIVSLGMYRLFKGLFVFLHIKYVCIVVVSCDTVHDVETLLVIMSKR